MAEAADKPASIDATVALLGGGNYLCSRELATAVFLAMELERPLLLEGEAGVGKTELAKVLASGLGRELIRLQCYEGLDFSTAVYDWDYARQLLSIRVAEAADASVSLSKDVYTEEFLIERPLLKSLRHAGNEPPVLLIDELDRADEAFEAFLLEILSEFQISIPELGTVKASAPPIVIITSNRTRDVHDALRRRCFYQWLDFPAAEQELRILELKVPAVGAALRQQIVAFVQATRDLDLYKTPGIAETIDWAQTLDTLNVQRLGSEVTSQSLGVLLKYQDDLERMKGGPLEDILAAIPGTAD